MRLLYRIQQHLSITEYEFRVLLVVCLIFICGLVARSYHGRPASFPADMYADDLALLQKGTASWQAAADSAATIGSAAPIDSTAAIDSAAADDFAAADSTAVIGAGDPEGGKALLSSAARININTATAAELEQLPRIGPATAARILARRRRRGAFRTVEELSLVRGIGPKTLADLKPLVTIGNGRR